MNTNWENKGWQSMKGQLDANMPVKSNLKVIYLLLLIGFALFSGGLGYFIGLQEVNSQSSLLSASKSEENPLVPKSMVEQKGEHADFGVHEATVKSSTVLKQNTNASSVGQPIKNSGHTTTQSATVYTYENEIPNVAYKTPMIKATHNLDQKVEARTFMNHDGKEITSISMQDSKQKDFSDEESNKYGMQVDLNQKMFDEVLGFDTSELSENVAGISERIVTVDPSKTRFMRYGLYAGAWAGMQVQKNTFWVGKFDLQHTFSLNDRIALFALTGLQYFNSKREVTHILVRPELQGTQDNFGSEQSLQLYGKNNMASMNYGSTWMLHGGLGFTVSLSDHWYFSANVSYQRLLSTRQSEVMHLPFYVNGSSSQEILYEDEILTNYALVNNSNWLINNSIGYALSRSWALELHGQFGLGGLLQFSDQRNELRQQQLGIRVLRSLRF
jgi:hypothetical protein